jgi:signal transduction histidine kinase
MSSDTAGKAAEPPENLGYASILRDSLTHAVIAFDSQKKITVFSPEAVRLTKLHAAEVLGESLEKLPAALQKIITEVFTSGRAIADRQIKLPVADGEHIVHVHAVVIPAGAREISGVILVLHDLSTAQRLESNLRRLDRLANIGTLSAGMAHEIKNATVAIRTFVELLLEKNQNTELADIVGREMKRIDGIVSQMLRVAGPAKPNIAPMHMHEVIDYTLRLVQHQLDQKLIVVNRSFIAVPDLVNGDLYQLEQALLNLFLNAIEAMSAGGELTLCTDVIVPAGQHPPQFRLTVQDTGVGIAPENMKRLFETFFTTKKTGTGLGLPITRRIIEEHGGVIHAVSELNRGAIFLVLLPLPPPKQT